MDQNNNVTNNTQENLNSNDNMIKCPNCGILMSVNARCCTRCGALNPLNTKNDNLNPLFEKGMKLKSKEKKNKNKSGGLFSTHSVSQEGEGTGITAKERFYSFFSSTKRVVILVIVILVVLNYKFILGAIDNFRKDHYIKQVNKIVEQVQERYTRGQCTETVPVSGNSRFVVFGNSSDYFDTSLSLFTFDYFTGYVEIIDNLDGNVQYRITITDGEYGLNNLVFNDNLDGSVVEKFNNIDYPQETLVCK